MNADEKGTIALIVSTFYPPIAARMMEGAVRVLEANHYVYARFDVPGCLEIPALIAQLHNRQAASPYAGYVALGCVIRGETYHFEYVCEGVGRGLMDLAVRDHVPIGQGILTVSSQAQAMARLPEDPTKHHVGAHAARACLSLVNPARIVAQQKGA